MAGLWYRLGTVTLTNGSKRVTGIGTTWNNAATGPIPGNTFWGPDSKPYEVERVISDLELDIVETYAGATVSGAPYKIDTTRKGTVPALASQVTATLSYVQTQYANMSTWAAGDMPVNVEVVLPDGISKKSIPNLVSMTQATALGLENAMFVGAFGLGAQPVSQAMPPRTGIDSTSTPSGFYHSSGTSSLFGEYKSYIHMGYASPSYAAQLGFTQGGHVVEMTARSTMSDGSWSPVVAFKHSGNTTVDGNGFLKAASPIVHLFSDSFEVNEYAAGVEAHRVGIGLYRIFGSQGFAKDGWYIEGPKDANGRLKIWIDYDQGADGVINIRTTHREFTEGPDAQRNIIPGLADGDPVDIPTGREITVRLSMPEHPMIEPKEETTHGE